MIPKIALFLVFLIISMPVCFATQLSLSYDANGNLITGDGLYRTYNSLNQLWKVYNGSTPTTLLEEYTYHPLEERVLMKKVYNRTGYNIETVYYINQNNVQVRNLSGIFNFTYYYLQGQLVAQDLNGVKTFFQTDQKGNIVAVTNKTGQIIEKNFYSPTGEILSGGNKSRYTYEVKEQYGSGVSNVVATYYPLHNWHKIKFSILIFYIHAHFPHQNRKLFI